MFSFKPLLQRQLCLVLLIVLTGIILLYLLADSFLFKKLPIQILKEKKSGNKLLISWPFMNDSKGSAEIQNSAYGKTFLQLKF